MKKRKRFKKWVYPKIVDGQPTKYHWVVQHKAKFKLGRNTDIGAFTYINASHGVVIGEGVQMGSHCSVYSESTIDDLRGKVVLMRNSKVGSHSVILPGVRIGENSIVGAFSFVNKNIPANSVAVGIPAKVIKKNRR